MCMNELHNFVSVVDINISTIPGVSTIQNFGDTELNGGDMCNHHLWKHEVHLLKFTTVKPV